MLIFVFEINTAGTIFPFKHFVRIGIPPVEFEVTVHYNGFNNILQPARFVH